MGRVPMDCNLNFVTRKKCELTCYIQTNTGECQETEYAQNPSLLMKDDICSQRDDNLRM